MTLIRGTPPCTPHMEVPPPGLKNWWPVSLINVDAEKASKAIALRIKKVIGKLVHYDQTAYVCNRNIGESVRLINDILEYTDDTDIEAIFILCRL